MPVDMRLYPAEWPAIRAKILRRAGGGEPDPRIGACCEWCGAANWQPHPITGSKVVLTIAHVDDHNPHDVADDNLAALCQRCHNRHDAPRRAAKRRARKAC